MNIGLYNIMINGSALPSSIIERATELVRKGASFFIANGIDRKPDILVMSARSVDFAKIVGFRLRYGDAIWMHDGAMRVVTRENWKETWRMITPKEPALPRFESRSEQKEETSFDIMLPRREDLPKWAGKSRYMW